MCKKEYKTILITGASSGLGKSLAIKYACEGVTLFLTARNIKRLTETANICKKNGAKVIFYSLDITNRKAVEKWILECDKIKNIDLVVANAGVSSGTICEENICEQVYNIFQTNIFGVLNSIEPIISEMKNRKSGQIAIISSMSSFIGMPSCPAYSSSKSCISAYGEALRGRLRAHNIGVSIVSPGFIKTPLTDKNNFKMPLIISSARAADKISKGLSKNKGLIVFPLIIYFCLKILRFLPFSFTNYLLSKLPKK